MSDPPTVPMTAVSTSAAAFIEERIAESRERLLAHPLYAAVVGERELRVFMRSHVFAVWDFMALLKRLQREVACVDVPWRPPADASLARFVNEIVVGEECDVDGRGGHASHFDLYLDAMRELHADADPIERLLGSLDASTSPADLIATLESLPIPAATKAFTRGNVALAVGGHPAEVAAAFCYGREDLIPEMFSRLVGRLRNGGRSVERFVYYLDRHIELDGGEHGPLARRLVDRLCGDDRSTWNRAAEAAASAVEARIALWDGILAEIAEEDGTP